MSVHNIHLAAGESCTINVTTDGAVIPPDPGPGPDPGPDPAPPGVRVIDLPWDSHAARTYTQDHGGFGPNDVLAFRFTTPTQVTGGAANISESVFPGHGGRPGSRQAVISLKAGDFDNPVQSGMARCESTGNEGTTITFTVGRTIPFTPELQGNTVYYYNLRYVNGADGGNIQIYRGGAAS